MNRRRFLIGISGLAGLASFSGCLLWGSDLSGSDPDEGYFLSARKLSDANFSEAFAISQQEFSVAQSQFVDDLQDSERTTRYEDAPFDDGEYVFIDETFYRIEMVDVQTETVQRTLLHAEAVSEESVDGEVVSLDYFSDEEYEAVHRAISFTYRGHPEPYVFHTPAEATPRLRPELQYKYVEFNGEYFRLSLSEGDVDVDRLEYSWTEVATSESEFENVIRDQLNIILVSPAEVSPETREILDEIEVTREYAGTRPYSDAEMELFEILQTSPKGGGSDERYLQLSESYYEITISWWHGD